ncbi:MAG: hypothetical protein ACI8UO_005609 [Verrucomicrobiales bacterium]|jgi:hypothetical protein
MATDYDTEFQIPLSRKLYFRAQLPKLISAWRRMARNLDSKKGHIPLEDLPTDESIFGFNRDEVISHYHENGWAFAPSFFNPEFHQKLAANWPSKKYFDPPRKPTKWYNTGFNWIYPAEPSPFFTLHSDLAKLFLGLGSSDFLEYVSELTQTPSVFHQFIMTDSGPGAEVPIHLDGLNRSPKNKGALGIAIFLEGTGGDNGGGLAISESNSWDDMIFEPKDLTNTALFYDKKIFHGFRQIAEGKFRHSINTLFIPTLSREDD